ncbi:type II toxin-antitoxin system VapC family toxin [Glycomyces paridis]|uniref:Type II toxin-antitoxin system VapC family toxin n=1 Tax=Glycomyces paridis TaxID=2126555 RepID=A0A4S8PBL2_9ACTN|nr:type II toxin-antitoxin system VapC family toxin [Glycomyces paridis]THV27698.1 type II toxin-antitoxin system VapC family toxin [Glycomyces paridis]
MDDRHDGLTAGLLDTCVLVDYARLTPDSLPDLRAVCTITLAELHAGPHAARDNPIEEVRRRRVVQSVESLFTDPLPFDLRAARAYGSVSLLTIVAGRKPRKYQADLMVASVAIANQLPLYTRNPKDFAPLESMLEIREV